MITLYLEAETLAELHRKLRAVLDDTTAVRHFTSPPLGGNSATQDYNLTPGVVTQGWPPERDPVPEAESKPRRKHRATRPPVATPDPVPEPMEDIDLGGIEDEVIYVDPEEALQGLTVASTPLTDSLTNEKVKAEVIGRLADLFTAGKVKVLRGLLDQYGDGAKSFPEIDAAKFPAIREALDRGIAA